MTWGRVLHCITFFFYHHLHNKLMLYGGHPPLLTVVYNQLVTALDASLMAWMQRSLSQRWRASLVFFLKKSGVSSTCVCVSFQSNVAFHRKLDRKAIWHRECGPCTPLGEDSTEIGRAILGQNRGENHKKVGQGLSERSHTTRPLCTHTLIHLSSKEALIRRGPVSSASLLSKSGIGSRWNKWKL